METQDVIADWQKTVSRSRLCVFAMLVVIGLIVVYRAAFSAYFLLDDFGMLSIVRFLDNPLEPFVRNHIPGGLYYRPLGMILWWLSERVFGANAFAHYLINLVLHAGVTAAMWRLVTKICTSRWIGLIAATCFAMHPIGIGTTLWLSDRFDLLALLFGLLGLASAVDFNRTGAKRSFWIMLGWLTLALLSKEIALACFAASAVILLNPENETRLAEKIRSCLILSLPVLLYLVTRFMVLGFPDSGMLEGDPGGAGLFLDGLVHWAGGFVDYLTYWPRLVGWKRSVLITGFSIFFALGMLASIQPWSARRKQGFLVGLSLCLSTAVLQFPLLGHFSVRLDASADTVTTIVNSRYFYTSFAGFLIAFTALLAPLLLTMRWPRIFSGLAVAMLLMAWIPASQAATRRHGVETQAQREIVDAATRAIAAMAIPSEGCQVYLLDTTNWAFGWVSDEAIKATTSDLGRLSGCLIQTEHTPWYHIAVLGRLDAEFLRPLRFISGTDESETQLPIGRARFLLLNLDSNAAIPSSSNARFLSWQGHDFVDVTDDVLNGRRKPTFVCNRESRQCQ